ncbi:MAG: radical SAM protein [Peptostreptococcaceae bacterium]|nr:radical SAM protein [Peptostreptococcaceae bacterium]
MIKYDMPLYRPPSEARSLIIQVTLGCSHNKCTFCSMYKSKNFKARSFEEIQEDLKIARESYPVVKRIFLADGDALILSMGRLVPILEEIQQMFPECERIGIYGTSRSIHNKTEEDLRTLFQLGIKIVYMGLESGDDKILENIQKGEKTEDVVRAGKKLMRSGIKLSVTVISGLGGTDRKEIHPLETAKALSEMKPDYIGFLALMIEQGTPLYDLYQQGRFIPLSASDIVDEMIIFLSTIDSEGTIFRCNHASNYFVLSGTLNRDVPLMLSELGSVKEDLSILKDERFRRL